MSSDNSIEERIERLHAHGIVDLHFDLPMELYEKRTQKNLVQNEFLPEFEAGDIGVLTAALYIEDRYLPGRGTAVGLEQIDCLDAVTEKSDRLVICRSYQEITAARAAGKIAVIISMEGVEPLAGNLDLLQMFYERGVRIIGLTHARTNAAGSGGIFAARGSSPAGLTSFGRDVVRRCQELGVIVDLAHLNPAGFSDIIAMTTKPVIVSHTNARKYFDIERNINDDQIRMIGEKGGVIGINTVLVGAVAEEATLDRYIDHITHVSDLIGIDGVGIGFDFFEFLYRQWPDEKKRELETKLTRPHFIPDLANHSHARNLTRRLIERGFADADIEKILYRNWMRIFEKLLGGRLLASLV